MSEQYKVEKCPCNGPFCQYWLVSPVAYMQGVAFTEMQARAVAALLNSMEDSFEAGRVAERAMMREFESSPSN